MADDFDDELFALAGGDEEADVEEGEASSVAASSPNSLGSGDMDESDSDHDDAPPAKPSDVPYPLEGKYLDARDKARILGMSQLEREEILGQRAEEMSKVHFQAELARRAASMQNNKKRKAESEEPEDMRKSSRQVKPKTNDRLEAYKRDREQRGQERQRQDTYRRDRRRSSSGDGRIQSDVDAEGESEDWDEGAGATIREEQPASLTHFESIRVGRAFYSVVCFHPGFEEAMTGTFGRIGVGIDSQRRTLYKMVQVKGFTTGKPYVFDGKNNKRVATDQYVICQHGSVKNNYPFHHLSNQRFTEADFNIYKQSLAEAGAKLTTQAAIMKKYEDLKALENHIWSDADINTRIARTEKFAHLLRKSGSDKLAPKIPTQAEVAAARLAEINRQNRRAEQERIRKMQIEERQAKQHARKRAEQEMRRKLAAEEVKKADALAASKNDSLGVNDLFDGNEAKATIPKPQENKKPERKGLPTFRKPKMDDDIIASMDIGIDIEI